MIHLARRSLLAGLLLLLVLGACATRATTAVPAPAGEIELPPPRLKSEVSLEEVLSARRSVREFDPRPLEWDEISQLLWAAQGESDTGRRTAPSAGALYPLEIYLALPEGYYHYQPQGHRLAQLGSDDLREALWSAGLRQEAVRQAPAVFIITAIVERTAGKYGERAERYVQLEAGHAAQNLLLQAVALDLGAAPIGAFDDERVLDFLDLPSEYTPLYLIPVGAPKQ